VNIREEKEGRRMREKREKRGGDIEK